MMRPTTPIGSRTEKFTASGPIGIEAPFISVTKPAKNSICAAAIMASRDHLAHRIAAIGGVDHREFAGIVAQHCATRFRILRALERRHAPPFLEAGRGRGDGGLGVGGAAIGDLAEALAGAGIDACRHSGRSSARAMRRRNRRRDAPAASAFAGMAACGATADVMAFTPARNPSVRIMRRRGWRYFFSGTWISSASCSLVSGLSMNFSDTASGNSVSRPLISSGSTIALREEIVAHALGHRFRDVVELRVVLHHLRIRCTCSRWSRDRRS